MMQGSAQKAKVLALAEVETTWLERIRGKTLLLVTTWAYQNLGASLCPVFHGQMLQIITCSKTAMTPVKAVSTSRNRNVHMKSAKSDVTMRRIQSVALSGSLPPGKRRSMTLIFSFNTHHGELSPTSILQVQSVLLGFKVCRALHEDHIFGSLLFLPKRKRRDFAFGQADASLKAFSSRTAARCRIPLGQSQSLCKAGVYSDYQGSMNAFSPSSVWIIMSSCQSAGFL